MELLSQSYVLCSGFWRMLVQYYCTPPCHMLSASCIFAHAGCENPYLGQCDTILLVGFTVQEAMTAI